jgi:outer membrane protein assembly factor BamE (lipoprotein component of BamABCDE complex)
LRSRKWSKTITDQSRVRQIQQGVSTRTDIVALFGQPGGKTFVSTLGDELWTYTFSSGQIDPKSYIPIVNAFSNGITAQATILSIIFDKNGIVKTHVTSTSGASTPRTVM